MDTVTQVIDYVSKNSDTLIQIGTSIVTIASIIVRFTPSDVDNKIVEKIVALINFLAINKPKK